MGLFSKYIRKHERPFSIGFQNGKGTIEVIFYDGYVTIQSRQPRRPMHEIHVPHSVWVRLLSASQSVTERMLGPDFDRYKAERKYYREEAQHQADLRAQKRERNRPRRRRT